MALGALLMAAALVLPQARSRPLHGWAVMLAFALLAAYTAFSTLWSLAPSDSWIEAGRTLAYLFAFAGTMALARLAPGQWPAVLHGLALACLVVCCWALLTKIFPGGLSPDETYARLRAPFGYWNATGLMAALGLLPLLWLGARRSGHAAFNALAWPGIALLEVCLMLSYSRGALLAGGRRRRLLVRRGPAAAARRDRAAGRDRRRGARGRLGVLDDRADAGRAPARGARRRGPRARRAALADGGAAARARPRDGLPGRRAPGLRAGQAVRRPPAAGRPRARGGRAGGRARVGPGRDRRADLQDLGPADESERADARQHAGAVHGRVVGAGALLGRGVRRARRRAAGWAPAPAPTPPCAPASARTRCSCATRTATCRRRSRTWAGRASRCRCCCSACGRGRRRACSGCACATAGWRGIPNASAWRRWPRSRWCSGCTPRSTGRGSCRPTRWRG